ncbi:hypothetical protein Tco_0977170 [Tanacetum coccineum]|uniref:Uncharacterized protein n=1 Tax=Tanacetum coccineum TaxID=301880 RepID=A0ABQ5EJD5_9ASTR
MPESSQQHIKIERICFDCGDLLHGLNCLECDLTRKILEKAFQKFQNTSKSSNDNSNVVNAPREPFVVKQDPSVNSSQKSPLIDQKCCCECGDSLDGIFCQQCTCKSCGRGAHVGYNCPPKTLIISNPEPTKQTINEIPQARKSIPSIVNYVEVCRGNHSNSEPVSSKVLRLLFPKLEGLRMHSFDQEIPSVKMLNVNRLLLKIEALKIIRSPQSFQPSSGSPTTHSELSLPDYKAFYIDNDHFKEKSSGSTTTHVDFSQYDSFIFDLSNDQFPPADRSDFYHEEFADELAQIISQPEYDRFCFKIEPELGNLTMDVVGNIFQESEPRVHVLNVLPTLELDFIPSSESIFAYVVWIFLPFLFIPVIPPYLLSCGDEDTIFDPGISKDCPDCEDSQFCHSSRVSHPQLHLGIRYPNLID